MFEDDIPEGFEVVSSASPRPAKIPSPQAFDYAPAVDIGSRWGTVTSTGRTRARNAAVGGARNSFHILDRPGGARAIDIARRRGVGHADIEAEYRAAGFELLESLDEGDHSHFAFARGPSAQSDIPDGWEVVSDQPKLAKPQGVIAAGFAGGSAPTPAPSSAPTAGGTAYTLEDYRNAAQPDYRSQVDPSKNARLQAAFDGGATLDQLTKMAGELGIQFEHGNTGPLRGAIAWRDKNGKGARIVPEPVKGPPPRLPGHSISALTTPDEPFGKTIPQRFGNLAREFGEMIGHPFANRLGNEAETIAEWAPIIGGASAIEEAKTDFGQGRYGSAAVNAGLGSLDFIPAIGPAGRMVGRTG